jgi:RecB family exonuclease
MPSKPDMDLLLPESMRMRLGLSYLNKHLSLQEKIFRRITASAGGLYLSYPSMEGDKFYLPSTFISDGESVETRLYGIFAEEEELLRKGLLTPPLSVHIKEVKGIKSFFDRKALNVTAIDAYRRCPRLFFIEHVLGLEPPEIIDYELEPKALGTIIHRVMEALIEKDLKDIDAFSEKASEVLDGVLLESDMDVYLKSLLRESFMMLVPEIYRLEQGLRADGYTFKSAEDKVEGEPVEGIRLKGKVDRIDVRGNVATGKSVQIIDYKTGNQTLSGPRVLNKGDNLQLPLYAAMLNAKGMKSERVGIYSLKDINIRWLPGRKDIKEGLTLDDYITSSLRFLKDTSERLRKGEFTAEPLNEQTCRKCPERPYCPYIQGGQGEAQEWNITLT